MVEQPRALDLAAPRDHVIEAVGVGARGHDHHTTSSRRADANGSTGDVASRYARCIDISPDADLGRAHVVRIEEELLAARERLLERRRREPAGVGEPPRVALELVEPREVLGVREHDLAERAALGDEFGDEAPVAATREGRACGAQIERKPEA